MGWESPAHPEPCCTTGNNDDALRDFNRSATILKNLKRPSAQETTMAQINVGFVYGYLGRYDEASWVFEAALWDRFVELGEDGCSSFV